MFNSLFKKVFGTKHERQMKKLRPLVTRIGDLEKTVKPLSDDDLKARTGEFKQRLDNGESLTQMLPEVFATVREASVRVLGMRHYDVQMIGGISMHQGKICEMRTGEGKTLSATSALFLNALTGRGCHLITVNDYLASRDAEWMGQIYNFLGLSVGTIVSGMFHLERQKAYRCDITYGTNNEFGFDYLRDNMKETIEKYVQRDLHFAIVDEVDSILIDEARTPLIISGEANKSPETYQTVNRVIPNLRRDLDFVLDEKAHSAQLTDSGVDRIEKLLHCKNLYHPDNIELLHHVNQALRAHVLYKKDVNYLVEGGEILIIDEFTGRKMEGRRWSEGLHQAIEAKEGVPIQPESRTLATITYQNYFRMYEKLSGMTGTAVTEAAEFAKIYDLDVIAIPPNRTIVRKDQDDLVYKNERGKFKAVIEEIRDAQERGQPVLVGTVSVEKSHVIHQLLDRAGIPHQVLNAKQHEREASVVAQAGRKGAVTVSTNMAGRGTDIILGGNAEMMARAHYDPDTQPEQYKKLFEGLKSQCEDEKKTVLENGGLYIIGTERHESRRIDNQLRGRAGRQGDPGASRFFLSLEDDLMRIFGADRITGLMERLGMEEDVPIEAGMVNKAIANAQTRVEQMHFDTRKNLFEYDNVMNEQRKAIYALRKQILEGRYQPEILDDAARKEQRSNLPPPPETSGPHTVESMGKDVHTRVVKIIDNHCRTRMEAAGENAGVDNPFPAAGIDHHTLTHDLYRHFGAMVPLSDVAQDREQIIAQSLDVVARSLIQQRERVHELAFKKVDEMVDELCPADVHPDEWDLPGLEAMTLERFGATVNLADVEDNLEKLVERVWVAVEALITKREGQFGLYTFLFYVRQFYLAEIDEQWIAHLKNIENLRTGIGLVGYATRNPKNEYKIRGFNLFRDMWASIEHTVLDKILSMRLTAEQQQKAEEGAEYETSVTRGNAGRRARNRGQGSRQSLNQDQAAKVQEAARQMMQSMQQISEAVADANPDDMIAKAAAKAASKSLKADDGSGRTGRRRRRKKASSEAS